jgi:predicted acylesterase/phospholipase RssA
VAASTTLPVFWYREPGRVTAWYYGAFEGGGAKGVAYAGALLALKEQRCWFRGVCGASAGAITAALVAAGVDPENLDDLIQEGLSTIKTGFVAGLRRLHSTTGYFTSANLRAWIEDVLKAQLGRTVESGPVTFEELHEASGIELNVVAADLSRRRQIVFSPWETPACSVADAVTASAAIPLAFPSQLLEVPDRKTGQVWHHTIVDGGVWANLPSFVFEDRAFREAYRRQPGSIPSEDVLLFLLKETDEEDPPCGEGVQFAPRAEPIRISAREWKESPEEQRDRGHPPALGSRIASAALWPFAAMGRAAEWNGSMERGRWPRPPAGAARNLVDALSGLLGGIQPFFLALTACAVPVVGAGIFIWVLATDWLGLIGGLDTGDPFDLIGRLAVVFLVAFACSIAVLVAFATILGVLANFLLLRTLRRTGYGLITTYAAGPGAPDWIARRDNVIALPIPPEVTTLSFEMPDDVKRRLLESAHDAAAGRLRTILARRARAGGS